MEETYQYVIVGGGVAAVTAAQNIRELDDEGRILLIGKEKHPPYDRPPLSKNMLAKDDYAPDDAYSKFDTFYPEKRVELHTATNVTSIDREARKVQIEDGPAVGYEKLLLATGSAPRPLDVPGSDRVGAFLLRRLEDSEEIRTALQHSKRGVIIGGSFLGMEVASEARKRGLDVTIIEKSGQPWSRFASEKTGAFIRGYYESNGIQFMFGEEVTAIDGHGESGAVTGVTTKSGRTVPADFTVAAIGAIQNLDLARDAGLEVSSDGVVTDEFLHTSDANIWAAGDIACFNDIASERRWHAEHHLNARWQGQAVGKIMAGGPDPYNRVPYFYSDVLDIHLILRGAPEPGRRTLIVGDLAGAEYTELYCADDGQIKMGVSISHTEKNLDPISDTLERLIRDKVNVSGREAEIEAPGFELDSLS